MKKRLPIDYLRQVLELDEATGILRWKQKIAKKIIVGSVAGSERHDGYKRIQINKIGMLLHHVVFALLNDRWPNKELDHANGNPSDNRPCNLRESDRHTNNYNRCTPQHNTSGIKGVFQQKTGKCWNARLATNSVLKRVSGFGSKEEANEFLQLWRSMAHGEFANNGAY